MELIHCKACNTDLNLNQFYMSAVNPDRPLQPCKECRKAGKKATSQTRLSPGMPAESAATFLREQADRILKHGGTLKLRYSVHYLDCNGKCDFIERVSL